MKFYKTDYKEVVFYELPYREISHENGNVYLDTVKYKYFIFSKNNKEGYTIEKTTDKFENKYNVDSVLTSSALKTLDVDTFFRLVTKWKREKINKHSFKISGDVEAPGYDSIYFYYNDKLLDINYFLSRKLDFMNKSKLYKVELIPPKKAILYNGYWYNPGIISFEIGKVKIENATEIEYLYQKFISSIKKN